MATLRTLHLPIPWPNFGLPNPLQTGPTCLVDGLPGWAWEPAGPDLEIPAVDATNGETAPGWDLDHVVLLVPDLGAALNEMSTTLGSPRLRATVKHRPTAFYRVGPVLEVIESPVRAPALYGVALVTAEPLEVVTMRWRAQGLDVGDTRPAMQPGRRIFIVKGTEAGLAVMSPDRARPGARQ